LLDRVNTL